MQGMNLAANGVEKWGERGDEGDGEGEGGREGRRKRERERENVCVRLCVCEGGGNEKISARDRTNKAYKRRCFMAATCFLRSRRDDCADLPPVL